MEGKAIVEESGFSKEEEEICKFFLEGKCRFGEECRNSHPSNRAPKKSPKKVIRPKSKEKEVKKSMKTALDVINRIEWDVNLPPEYFRVGYLDRFKGIVEEPFSKFSNWNDLPNADLEALAIPQHRIRYFKYKDTKVWDKTERLDLVFNSVKEGMNIVDLMNEVDDR